jgi:uncharacterized membrane protein
MNTFISDISQKEFPITEQISGNALRPELLSFIQKTYSAFSVDHYLALAELKDFRTQYYADYLATEVGELSELDNKVLDALKENTTISNKIDDQDEVKLSFGQKVADKVAFFGGSWTFIISFGCFLVLWILFNFFWLSNQGFDPYPFILLNLILSCLAAMQAPVIMMSQNRQQEKDREEAKKDYMINLKSELEIRVLHEKIDHLILNQHQEMIALQKKQIDLLNSIIEKQKI